MRHTVSLMIVLLLGAGLLSGCSPFDVDEEPIAPEPIDFSMFSQDSTLLVGAWEWKRSTYYFTVSGEPSAQTPSSTGRTEMLVFTEDATLEVYRNGELERRAAYETWEHLYQEEYGSSALFGVRGDILAISSAPVDGPESVYERVE